MLHHESGCRKGEMSAVDSSQWTALAAAAAQAVVDRRANPWAAQPLSVDGLQLVVDVEVTMLRERLLARCSKGRRRSRPSGSPGRR